MTQKARLNRLWVKASNGDKRAFGELFDEIGPDIYRFARRRLPGDSQAEEVVAETFLQLWKRRDFTLEPDVSIRAWVFGIAANLVRRQWRSSGRYDAAVNRLATLDAVETVHPDVSQQVAQSVDANRRVRVVLAALERLPAETKELLVMRAWDELDYAEMAQVLECPIGTVSSRLARARHRLESEVEQILSEVERASGHVPNGRRLSAVQRNAEE